MLPSLGVGEAFIRLVCTRLFISSITGNHSDGVVVVRCQRLRYLLSSEVRHCLSLSCTAARLYSCMTCLSNKMTVSMVHLRKSEFLYLERKSTA